MGFKKGDTIYCAVKMCDLGSSSLQEATVLYAITKSKVSVPKVVTVGGSKKRIPPPPPPARTDLPLRAAPPARPKMARKASSGLDKHGRGKILQNGKWIFRPPPTPKKKTVLQAKRNSTQNAVSSTSVNSGKKDIPQTDNTPPSFYTDKMKMSPSFYTEKIKTAPMIPPPPPASESTEEAPHSSPKKETVLQATPNSSDAY